MREFGSEYPIVVLPDGYFENLNRFDRHIMYLRCGREALMATAMNCKYRKNPVILIPAYCCWSMSAPFEKVGWKIVYYRLNKDLSVDQPYMEHLLHTLSVDAVMVMNYYGVTPTNSVVQMIKSYSKDIVVIEDFSHCTFSFASIYNDQVDYYVSSIRKSIGVSDGAIILSKQSMLDVDCLNETIEFSKQRQSAQLSKYKYFYTQNSDEKRLFLEDLHRCEDDLNNFDKVHKISQLAMQMLSMINGEEIAFARRKNMSHLLNLLEGKIEMIPNIYRCCNDAPFSLPILVDNRDEFQKKLAEKGVYAPVLWPICDEASDVCKISKMVSDRMLSIPIDQRYGWDDIEEIGERIINCVG